MSHKITHKGKTVTLPDFKNLPVGVVRKARNLAADEQMWFILESTLDEKAMAIVDEMNISEFTDAMNAWTQGAPVGESLQSSN